MCYPNWGSFEEREREWGEVREGGQKNAGVMYVVLSKMVWSRSSFVVCSTRPDVSNMYTYLDVHKFNCCQIASHLCSQLHGKASC